MAHSSAFDEDWKREDLPFPRDKEEYKAFERFDKALQSAQTSDKEILSANVNRAARIASTLRTETGIQHVVCRLLLVSKDPTLYRETVVYCIDSILRHVTQKREKELRLRYQSELKTSLRNVFKRGIDSDRDFLAEKFFEILMKWREKGWFKDEIDGLVEVIHRAAPKVPKPKEFKEENSDEDMPEEPQMMMAYPASLKPMPQTPTSRVPQTPMGGVPTTPVIKGIMQSVPATPMMGGAAVPMTPIGAHTKLQVMQSVPATPAVERGVPMTPGYATPGYGSVPMTPGAAMPGGSTPAMGDSVPMTPMAAFGPGAATPLVHKSANQPFTPSGPGAPTTPRGAPTTPQPFTPRGPQPMTPAGPPVSAQPVTPRPPPSTPAGPPPATPASPAHQPFTPRGPPPGTPAGAPPATPASPAPFTPAGPPPSTPAGAPATPASPASAPFTPAGPPPGTPAGPPPATPAGMPPGTPAGPPPPTPASPGRQPFTPMGPPPATPASPGRTRGIPPPSPAAPADPIGSRSPGRSPGRPPPAAAAVSQMTPATPMSEQPQSFRAQSPAGLSPAVRTPLNMPVTPKETPGTPSFVPVPGGDAAPATPKPGARVPPTPLASVPGTPGFAPVPGGEAAPQTPAFARSPTTPLPSTPHTQGPTPRQLMPQPEPPSEEFSVATSMLTTSEPPTEVFTTSISEPEPSSQAPKRRRM
ncbi:unnamed protein product [Effrenium voratum]|uniref:CID domain-containing protein n=2 Tax=Effrenium voratum TaxID=2562239 RepID=A0AA36I5Z6_9DINO|nr:unnamed protein product [Effrenium voratum]CAJ1381352.1 unnamed protein product [Effrenium voratum]CAJ1439792.1 unnamed protein product [Effrenium voratum]